VLLLVYHRAATG